MTSGLGFKKVRKRKAGASFPGSCSQDVKHPDFPQKTEEHGTKGRAGMFKTQEKQSTFCLPRLQAAANENEAQDAILNPMIT